MKLIQQLLQIGEAVGIYKPITDKEVAANNKQLMKSGGKMVKSKTGQPQVVTDGDKTLTKEDAEYAKVLVRGEKSGPGLMNKLDQWFGKLMITKDANRFLPARIALDQLKRAGFSKDQIYAIRDAATHAANTAVETMHKKYGEEAVPKKYISSLPSSFGVFDLYLNVSEDIHKEFAALMRKLFDAKIDKIKDTLVIQKEDVIDPSTVSKINQLMAEGKLDAALAEIREAADINDTTVTDMEDRKTADELEEGDLVEITGKVTHEGEEGTIVRFGSDKRFVVVEIDGKNYSFHSSDVTEASGVEGGDDDDEDDDDADDRKDTFYVAFYDNDEQRSWIGEVSKAAGGKWHESAYRGKPENRWGQTYMSYLTPSDVMSWIHKDYHRGVEIEGPFFDAKDAEEFVEHNWGTLEEAQSMGAALRNSLSKVEPGSKLDKAIKQHNAAIKAGKAGTLKQAPDGYRFKKDGSCVLGDAKPVVETAKAPRKGSLAAEILADRKKADKKLGNYEIKDDMVGTAKVVKDHTSKFTVANKSGKVVISVNGSAVASMEPEDFADMMDAVKNRVPGSFGHYKLEHKGDSYTIMNSSGKDVAQLTSAEMDGLRQHKIAEEAYTDFDDWKQAVLNSYPTKAKQIKFKGRMEGGKDTISAEVPGEDRCYGVWNQEKEKGVVLSEAKGDMIKAYGIKDKNQSPFKIHAKVKIKSSPSVPKDVVGKEGVIGEIRRDAQGIATFTIDYDFDEKTGHYKSIQLKKADISLIRK